MLLVGNAVVHIAFFKHLRSFFLKPHLFLLSMYVLLSGLSVFWSADTIYYAERMQIALPFLFLPFAFHSMNRFDIRWYDALFVVFILLTGAGMSWSLFQYVQHKEAFDAGYGFSQVIPTPFKNDHIRFSLAVVLSICFCTDLFSRVSASWGRVLLAFFVLFAVVYLHILSTKTGLLVFYLVSLLFLVKLMLQKPYRKTGYMILLVLLVLPFIMYIFSTSFRNKIGYVGYSISQMQNQQKEANISDEGRLISYEYALDCIGKNPLSGVGLGDVRNEMKTYYTHDYGTQPVNMLLPHNQFLMTGMAIGIPGLVFLCILQLVLLRRCYRHDFLSFVFWCIMFFAMMVEPLYETQYGTCMFVFFLLVLLHRRTKTA